MFKNPGYGLGGGQDNSHIDFPINVFQGMVYLLSKYNTLPGPYGEYFSLKPEPQAVHHNDLAEIVLSRGDADDRDISGVEEV